MKKAYLLLMLALLFCVASFIPASAAAPYFKLNIDHPMELPIDDPREFDVYVSVSNFSAPVNGIMSYNVYLGYPSDLVFVRGETLNPDENGAYPPFENSHSSKPGNYIYMGGVYFYDIEKDTQLYKFTFKLSNTAMAGDKTYEWIGTATEGIYGMVNGQTYEPFKDGEIIMPDLTFKIVNPSVRYGDVNDDGSVDPLDVAILSRYVANWPGYSVNEAAADVNIDGSIDPLDAAILARHVANWPGYLTLPYKMPIADQPHIATNTSDGPAISVGSITGKAGDRVVIPISLENNSGIIVMRLSVDFDNKALRLLKVEDQGKLNGSMHPPVSDSPCILLWADPFSSVNNTFSGKIVDLHFEILEDVVPGESKVTVTYGPNDIFNKDLELVSFEVEMTMRK
jgi:hypothetical protein